MSLKNFICKLVLASIIYNIWKERNNRTFPQQASTKEALMKRIKNDVRDKALDNSKVTLSMENFFLIAF